jgi:6-pyruvoyltetrahydropterin/6-carboxytetrahydropterin synthase
MRVDNNRCLISRKIEIDMGHRVPRHGGQCANIHGHRYVIEVHVSGPVQDNESVEDGMVVDFGYLKRVMMEEIHEQFDHGFAVAHDDKELLEYLRRSEYKHVWIPEGPPTAEVLARLWYRMLSTRIGPIMELVRVKVWETPNCWAQYPVM